MSRYPYGLGAAEAVIGQNLARLDADAAGALEARRAHLRELSLALNTEKLSADMLIERLGGITPDQQYQPPCLAENADFVTAAFASLSLAERIELFRLICADIDHVPSLDRLLEAAEPMPAASRGVIAYLQNAFTDRAYHAFSALLPRARSQYFDSYGAACEAVSNGTCEACILPIEHARDGKLIGFYRLINRYELKIVCTCDIAQPDGTESRFALLQKGFRFPLPDEAQSYCFELSITRSAGHSLASVLDAAALCGLTLRRVDSIPLLYAEDSFAYHIVLTADAQKQFLPLLLYLSLDLPEYEPIGIYAHIFE